MAKAPPSFDLFYNDWITGTDELSDKAYRWYLRMLIYQWNNGFIPEREVIRMNICHCRDKGEWDSVWDEIRHKFVPVESSEVYGSEGPDRIVWVNTKMHLMRNDRLPKYEANAANSRKNGKKGGRPKKPRNNPAGNPDNNPLGSSQKPTSGRRKTEDGSTSERSEEESLGYTDSRGARQLLPSELTELVSGDVATRFGKWLTVRCLEHGDIHYDQLPAIWSQLTSYEEAKRGVVLDAAIANGWKTLDNGAAKAIATSETPKRQKRTQAEIEALDRKYAQ